MYFLAGINTQQFWNIPEEKIVALLRILNLFIKSLVNPFFVTILTISDSSFNSFSTNTCFVLFEVTFLFKFFRLSLKSVIFTKSAISFLLAKFACAYLAAKFLAVNLLNSGVVIYLSWSWSVILFPVLPIFVL